MTRWRWAAFALAAAGMIGCGGGGATFNPTPAVSVLFPARLTAGSHSVTVLIGGTNFQANSTTQWNGVDRPSVFNDATGQIAMTLLDGDFVNPGSGQVTVTNPTPGGGTSLNAASLMISPQAVGGPVIIAIVPASAVAGGNQAVTITVSGNNFLASDAITLNGTPLTTMAVGTPVTQLTTTIGAENLAVKGLASIAVQTTTANIASPSVKFPIGPATNPAPTLTSLSPASAKPGVLPTAGFLQVTGKNFVPGSVVQFNGTPRPTGYASDTVLTVGVLASDVASAGTVSVMVVNPTPGGGASSAVNFTVQ